MSKNFSRILIDQYREGDSQAAGQIYARYAKRLLGLASSRIFEVLQSKVEPDDIVQESFAAFFKMADEGRVQWAREGDLWRLLAGIAANQVNRQVEHFDAAKRDIAVEKDSLVDQLTSEESFDACAATELADLVDSLLDQKPLTKKILLARLAGFRLGEIAEQVGRSERTVRRVLRALRARLAQQYDMEFTSGVTDSKQQTEQFRQFADGNIQDYDLLRMIGVGQYGKVYLAHDNVRKEQVAVKVLKKSWLGNADVEELFLSEARKVSQLAHSGVVRFNQAGPLANGSWFFAMEFVPGQTLHHVNKAGMESRLAIRWLAEIAEAVAYLHHNGVVHGDLQPANVIVSDDSVKLIDFGFSALAFDTNQRFVGGTEGFVAPELRPTFAADVYSLGKLIGFVAGEMNPEDPLKIKLHRIVVLATQNNPQLRPAVDEIQTWLQES